LKASGSVGGERRDGKRDGRRDGRQGISCASGMASCWAGGEKDGSKAERRTDRSQGSKETGRSQGLGISDGGLGGWRLGACR
jgi:hypothetical protein